MHSSQRGELTIRWKGLQGERNIFYNVVMLKSNQLEAFLCKIHSEEHPLRLENVSVMIQGKPNSCECDGNCVEKEGGIAKLVSC